MKSLRVTAMALSVLASGCLQADPHGNPDQPGKPDIQDEGRLAGATSSTNWPGEDAGTQPIQIFGTADSILAFTFTSPPAPGEVPAPVHLSGEVRLYRAGVIPIFDSVPTLKLDFPLSDTFAIAAKDINPLISLEMDTLRFTVEFRTDTSMALIPGFVFSAKQGKFLEWPATINSDKSLSFSNPHYKFASIPDSAFTAILADTAENARFYYYIPATPYFWRHEPVRDSLYIGPTSKQALPLRFIKIMSHAGSDPDFSIEAYPLSLAKESVNDSLHHFEQVERFQLGSLLFKRSGKGRLEVRVP